MTQIDHIDIHEMSPEEIDGVSGGGIVIDTIVNVARKIADTVNPPTQPITPPSIPQIGGAIASAGSLLGSIF
jgi:hypothetical protein